jgi:hypothetical protein
MNKLVIPSILAATVLIAASFAIMPVEKASTVHTFLSQQGAVKGTEYSWILDTTVTAAARNGTLLANFAGAGLTKVTGTVVISADAVPTGTTDVYSGNGTQVASASSLDPIRSFTFTLGGNGLDLRANVSASSNSGIFFTVIDTD